MLAPISRGRHDKRSSFKQLKAYLLEGRDPRTQERCARGEFVLSENLEDVRIAHLQMRAVAFRNRRVTDPVYHFEITWPPGENPTKDQWLHAAHYTLTALGFSEHQYIIGAHDDTKHFHVHVMVNRVHPLSFRAHYPYKDMLTLDKCMREVEHEQGWTEGIGHFRWEKSEGRAVLNTPTKRKQLSAAAKAIEHETEEHQLDRREELLKYVSGEPARALNVLLKKEASWQDVHRLLHGYGLALDPSERGGYMVREISTGLRIKSSDAFRATFAGKENRRRTEETLGAWQNAAPEIYSTQPQHTRDQSKREKEAEERAQKRRELKHDFGMYRSTQRAKQKEVTATPVLQRKEVYRELKAEKAGIWGQGLPFAERKSAISKANAEAAAKLLLIKAQTARKRAEVAPLPYQHWVLEQVKAGDERAISQARAWKYKLQREFTRSPLRPAGEQMSFSAAKDSPETAWTGYSRAQLNALQEASESEELARTITSVKCLFDPKNGDAHYKIKGRIRVVDRGKRVAILDEDESAILFGLQIAVQKYGMAIHAEGSEQWKAQVARVAAKHGLKVCFDDDVIQKAMIAEQERRGRFGDLVANTALLQDEIARSGSYRTDDVAVPQAALAAAFGVARGKDHLQDVIKNMKPGTAREMPVQGKFKVLLEMHTDRRISFEVAANPGKKEALLQLLADLKQSAKAAYANRKAKEQLAEIGRPTKARVLKKEPIAIGR